MQQQGLAHCSTLHLGRQRGQQEGVGVAGLGWWGKMRRVGRGRRLMCSAYDTPWTGRKLCCRWDDLDWVCVDWGRGTSTRVWD